MAGPSGAATPQVKTALRKLLQALPAPLRDSAEAAAAAIVIDPASWGRTAPSAPAYLAVLQRAAVEGEQVVLAYTGRSKAPSERVVSPYGLVAKGGVWYLVAGTDQGTRTFRVGRVTAVTPTGTPVVRPAGFDLAAAWRRSMEEVDRRRSGAAIQGLAEPRVLPLLRAMLGPRLRVAAADDGAGHAGRADGRIEVTVSGPSVPALAAELAGFGPALEITGPDEARSRLQRLGRELQDLYADAAAP